MCPIYWVLLSNLHFSHLREAAGFTDAQVQNIHSFVGECSCISSWFYNWIKLKWTGLANVTIVGELSFRFYGWIELNWTGFANVTIVSEPSFRFYNWFELNWTKQGLQALQLSLSPIRTSRTSGRPSDCLPEFTIEFNWTRSARYAKIMQDRVEDASPYNASCPDPMAGVLALAHH